MQKKCINGSTIMICDSCKFLEVVNTNGTKGDTQIRFSDRAEGKILNLLSWIFRLRDPTNDDGVVKECCRRWRWYWYLYYLFLVKSWKELLVIISWMLKYRRDRGDLIQLFGYFKSFDNINLSNAPKFRNDTTGGHR